MKRLHEISWNLAAKYRHKAKNDRDTIEYNSGDKSSENRAIRRTKGIAMANRAQGRADDRRDAKYKERRDNEKKAAVTKHGDLGKTHLSPAFRFRHYGTAEDDKKLNDLKQELRTHNKSRKPGDPRKSVAKFARLGKNSPHAKHYKGKGYGSYQRIKSEHGAYHDIYVHDRYHEGVDHSDLAALAQLWEEAEVERVDELSKKTLGSYVKKAASSIGNLGAEFGKAVRDDDDGAPQRRKSAITKYTHRRNGVERAADRLTKEEEEEEMSDNKGIVECVLDEDLAGLTQAFDDLAKGHSSALLEAVLEAEGGEPLTEEEVEELESMAEEIEGEESEELSEDEDLEEDSTIAYHDWDVKVHAKPDHKSKHKVVKVRARTHFDARRYAREKAPTGYRHALTAVQIPGTELLNKR